MKKLTNRLSGCLLGLVLFIHCPLQSQESISSVRTKSLESEVSIQGVVTRSGKKPVIYLQDSTAGMAVYPGLDWDNFRQKPIEGEEVRISGKLINFQGLLEVGEVTECVVISRNNPLPTPKLVNIPEIGENYEGQLVIIPRVEFQNNSRQIQPNTTYQFRDEVGNESVVYIDWVIENLSEFPRGIVDIKGVVSQFDFNSRNSGYQILISSSDDVMIRDSTKTYIKEELKEVATISDKTFANPAEIGDFIDNYSNIDSLKIDSKITSIGNQLDRGEVSQALFRTNALIDEFPRSSMAYYTRGTIYAMYYQDYSAALNDLNNSIVLKSDLTIAKEFRFIINFDLEKYSAAISDISDVITSYESSPIKSNEDDYLISSLYGLRGDAHIKMNALDKANSDFIKCLELNNFEPLGHFGLGNVFATKGQYEMALESYKRALDNSLFSNWVTDSEIIINKSIVLSNLGRSTEAIHELDSIISIEPLAETIVTRAEIHFLNADYRLALFDVNRSLEINNQIGYSYALKAIILSEMGNKGQFEFEFNNAKLLDPGNYKIFLYSGIVKSNNGNNSDAIYDFNKSIEIYESSDAFLNRGISYLEQGYNYKACQDWEIALSKSPNYSCLRRLNQLTRDYCK